MSTKTLGMVGRGSGKFYPNYLNYPNNPNCPNYPNYPNSLGMFQTKAQIPPPPSLKKPLGRGGGGGLKKQPLQNCIGPTIRIGRESWCLPYAGVFFLTTRIFNWILPIVIITKKLL